MKARAEAAPALARGIRLLRLLEDGAARSLEQIAQATEVPKASLLRLLSTLMSASLIQRDDALKTYRALVCLAPLPRASDALARSLPDVLARLADHTGATAEWYVSSDRGLLLVQRVAPRGVEVRVVARIGFVRAWDGELDATASVGLAFAPEWLTAAAVHWAYVADGRRSDLTSDGVRRRIDEARRRRWAADNVCNANGVKRTAAAVTRDGRLAGVLALARSYTPGDQRDSDLIVDELVAAANGLSECGSKGAGDSASVSGFGAIEPGGET